MALAITCCLNKATEEEIAEHLCRCDADFKPPLSSRVTIVDYARKVTLRALRFEAWSSGKLVGLVAVYCNDPERRSAFITSVSVLKEWVSKGIAGELMKQCIEHAVALGLRRISLEVSTNNTAAIRLYEKKGFTAGTASKSFVTMKLFLK